MRVAVFDLDGTLADTSIDLIAAANAALAEAGRGAPLDVAQDKAVAFAGGRAMLRAGLERLDGAWDEEEVARLFPRLLKFYGDAIDAHSFVYDGVEAALDRLEASDWRLAVCTNKPTALAKALLGRLGLAHRLAAMLGADCLGYKKPDPRHLLETVVRAGGEPGRAVMIGDTPTDRETARAAGLPCVLVAFGPEGAGLARLEPEAMLAHYDDLPELLERLVPRAAIPA